MLEQSRVQFSDMTREAWPAARWNLPNTRLPSIRRIGRFYFITAHASMRWPVTQSLLKSYIKSLGFAHRRRCRWSIPNSDTSIANEVRFAVRNVGIVAQSTTLPATPLTRSSSEQFSPTQGVCKRPRRFTSELLAARKAASPRRTSTSASFFAHKDGIPMLASASNARFNLTRNAELP